MFFSNIGVPGWRRKLRVGLAVMTIGLGLSGCGGGNGNNNAASNVVYLESNDPTTNTIIAYSRASDGNVSPLPGSPIDLKGQGLANPTANVGPPDGDNQIVASSDKKYIF